MTAAIFSTREREDEMNNSSAEVSAPIAPKQAEPAASRPRYMMATTAIHQLGDISRAEPDLCVVKDDGDDYVGHWVCGFGYVNVRFPKATTRPLTPDEIKTWNGQAMSVGSWGYRIGMDSDGYPRPVKEAQP